MTEDRRTPQKMWFKPMPNPDRPLDGGAVLYITNRDGDTYTVGLDLARLLQTQIVLANTIAVVLAKTLTKKSASSDITEDEIQNFIRELDTPTEEGTTNE